MPLQELIFSVGGISFLERCNDKAVQLPEPPVSPFPIELRRTWKVLAHMHSRPLTGRRILATRWYWGRHESHGFAHELLRTPHCKRDSHLLDLCTELKFSVFIFRVLELLAHCLFIAWWCVLKEVRRLELSCKVIVTVCSDSSCKRLMYSKSHLCWVSVVSFWDMKFCTPYQPTLLHMVSCTRHTAHRCYCR